MKNLAINRLAPCMVAVAVTLTTSLAIGQEIVHEGTVSDGATYVGDVPCNDCGNQDGNGGGMHGGHGGMHGGNGGGLHGGGGLFGHRNREVEFNIHPRTYGRPDLFYNYYTQGFANRANAQMYLCPVPVPPHVGHTWYTYQPFLPQHYMYPHTDKYHRYYDAGRGTNRTKVSYWTSPKSKIKNIYWNYFRIPR